MSENFPVTNNVNAQLKELDEKYSKDAIITFEEKIEEIEEIINKNAGELAKEDREFYIDNQLLPNYLVKQKCFPFSLFKKVITLGFIYTVDALFVNYIVKHIRINLELGNPSAVKETKAANEWLQNAIYHDDTLENIVMKALLNMSGIKFEGMNDEDDGEEEEDEKEKEKEDEDEDEDEKEDDGEDGNNVKKQKFEIN